jgi:hypothetical protein
MGKIKSGYKPTLKIVLFLLIGCFAGSSLGKNGDEDLLRQAKQFFSPLPQVMLSEKNPVTYALLVKSQHSDHPALK